MGSLESELNKAKLALAAIDQLKVDLATIKKARDASYAVATQAQNEVATIVAQSTSGSSIGGSVEHETTMIGKLTNSTLGSSWRGGLPAGLRLESLWITQLGPRLLLKSNFPSPLSYTHP